MFENKEVAARHLPVAHGPAAGTRGARDTKADASRDHLATRRTSETRMQATVVVVRKGDDGDPYADVPCTD
jgi:hypothetical protein